MAVTTIPDLLTVPEAAERLRLSPATVWRMIARCDLDAVRYPGHGRTLVRAESVADLIERSTERAIVLRPTVRASARSRRAGSA